MSRNASSPSLIEVAFDIGGTFTDIILREGDRHYIAKRFTDPNEPCRPVHELCMDSRFSDPALVLHGTTMATNALLERRGSKTALFTTKGFEDVLEIGRQDRPSLYDLQADKASPLVPRSLRIGIRERSRSDGGVESTVRLEEVRQAINRARTRGVKTVAVAFLHSTTNPENERRVGLVLSGSELPFSLSHEVARVSGEYERTAVTVANAYLLPVMAGYIGQMKRYWPGATIRVMQSNGGMVSADTAAGFPVRTVLSGPAAGVIGAVRIAKAAGHERIITLDMGGTSTDVCLWDGRMPWTEDTEVGGIPIPTSMIDIVTVGSGGGSLARVDPGGALRVGPESAGAEPGPICYGKGGRRPTLTDAHVYLGRIPPDRFLGGRHPLEASRLAQAFGRLGSAGSLDALEAAHGVTEVANTIMEAALRKVSIERGHDPREFTLVAFGGAAGLHACELAERLGMRKVLIPPHPGLVSAFGLLLADVVHERSLAVQKVVGAEVTLPWIRERAHRLAEQVLDELNKAEGVPKGSVRVSTSVLLRYRGQASGFLIRLSGSPIKQFHKEHQQRYGFHRPGRAVEVVRILARGFGRSRTSNMGIGQAGSAPDDSAGGVNSAGQGRSQLEPAEKRPVWFRDRFVRTPFFDRERLRPGTRLLGPAVIHEYSSTVVIPPGFTANADRAGNLVLHRKISLR